MALVVETGAGLSNADAFVSVADCTTYCTNQGLTGWGSTRDADLDEAAIRRATTWLSNSFTWKGSKLNGRAQALAWPRTDVEDEEGEDVASDEVPAEIVTACCIAASYERANPGGLSPNVTLHNRVKSKGIGPLRKEFFAAPLTADAMRPILTQVTDLISGLQAAGSSSLVGRVVRG